MVRKQLNYELWYSIWPARGSDNFCSERMLQKADTANIWITKGNSWEESATESIEMKDPETEVSLSNR